MNKKNKINKMSNRISNFFNNSNLILDDLVYNSHLYTTKELVIIYTYFKINRDNINLEELYNIMSISLEMFSSYSNYEIKKNISLILGIDIKTEEDDIIKNLCDDPLSPPGKCSYSRCQSPDY
jgi:hypothetical protein